MSTTKYSGSKTTAVRFAEQKNREVKDGFTLITTTTPREIEAYFATIVTPVWGTLRTHLPYCWLPKTIYSRKDTMARANEEAFEELHNAVTKELAARVRLGSDCSTADLKASMEWLKVNNITGVAASGTPLKALLDGLTDGDKDFVERLTT
jgi:hypothetical protein